MVKIAGAVVLLVLAGPAWAQSEQEVTAAVGKQVDAYTACLKQQAADLAKSSDPLDAVVDHAIAACLSARDDLLQHLQQPPLKASADEANAAIEQSLRDLRPKLLQTVQAARAS